MQRAIIFPGQGSQFVGMGKDLAASSSAARDVFAQIDDALSQKLSDVIFNGPAEDLNLTENTQAALMAVSLALIKVVELEANIDLTKFCKFMAGHSLGEYSALAASKFFTIEDAARLLKIRGKAMQQAVSPGEGAMAAIIGADFEAVRQIASDAAQGEVCQIANYNSLEQIVISGHNSAVDRAIEIAVKLNKRAVKLNVSAPFHSQLMQPAVQTMQQALNEVQLTKPVIPIIANVTAKPAYDVDEIKSLLVSQICGTVKWYDSVNYLKSQGIDTIIEVGAGKVLTGLTKRIDKEMQVINIQSMADIEQLVKICA